jgi:hypothetical protein
VAHEEDAHDAERHLGQGDLPLAQVQHRVVRLRVRLPGVDLMKPFRPKFTARN